MGEAWVAGLKSLLNPNNLRIIVINFHQDFVASMHSDSFQEKVDKVLTCWPRHSRETQLSKQEVEEKQKEALTNLSVWHLMYLCDSILSYGCTKHTKVSPCWTITIGWQNDQGPMLQNNNVVNYLNNFHITISRARAVHYQVPRH